MTGDMNSPGWRARAECSAVVPALGTPMIRKSGRAMGPPTIPIALVGMHLLRRISSEWVYHQGDDLSRAAFSYLPRIMTIISSIAS
ncbi:hypothetical protein GCM10009530_74230 [Microbispora corallina]